MTGTACSMSRSGGRLTQSVDDTGGSADVNPGGAVVGMSSGTFEETIIRASAAIALPLGPGSASGGVRLLGARIKGSGGVGIIGGGYRSSGVIEPRPIRIVNGKSHAMSVSLDVFAKL